MRVRCVFAGVKRKRVEETFTLSEKKKKNPTPCRKFVA